jgi:hypothetical protein
MTRFRRRGRAAVRSEWAPDRSHPQPVEATQPLERARLCVTRRSGVAVPRNYAAPSDLLSRQPRPRAVARQGRPCSRWSLLSAPSGTELHRPDNAVTPVSSPPHPTRPRQSSSAWSSPGYAQRRIAGALQLDQGQQLTLARKARAGRTSAARAALAARHDSTWSDRTGPRAGGRPRHRRRALRSRPPLSRTATAVSWRRRRSGWSGRLITAPRDGCRYI